MALKVCDCCTTKCAADLTCCPHCGCTDLHEEGEMPKITVHGGPTDAADIVEPEPAPEPAPDGADEDGAEVPAEGPTANAPEADAEPAPSGLVVDETEPEAEPEPTEEPTPEPVRPAASASKAKWVAYVEALGEDPGDRTRDELAVAYGG